MNDAESGVVFIVIDFEKLNSAGSTQSTTSQSLLISKFDNAMM